MAGLFNSVHCRFAAGVPSSSISYRFSFAGSFATNFVALWTVSRCFLKLDVELRALDNVFWLGAHNVQQIRKFFTPSSTTTK